MLVFNKLSRQSTLRVIDLRLADVQTLFERPARKRGYSDVYGARVIARAVRTDVLFPLAQEVGLFGE